MCIGASVGRGGKNLRDDVRTVQLLLNMNHPQVAGPLVPDGSCGPATCAMIAQFQAGIVGGRDAAGVVTPDDGTLANGTTLRALRGGMPPGFTQDKLQAIYIHAGAADVLRFFAAVAAAMQEVQIDSMLRQAHFLAQVGHESGEFRYTEEIASGAAYEGRSDLGNVQPGDGVRFKGRGLIQLTGRANYIQFGKFLGQDLLQHPEAVAQTPWMAVDAATWFWSEHGLNALADADDLRKITKRINGGYNGLPDRAAKLARARWFLEDPHPDPSVPLLIRAMEAVAGDPV